LAVTIWKSAGTVVVVEVVEVVEVVAV
jgi:hypothetical protein